MTAADAVDWAAMAGRRVTFTYPHGERCFGVITSARRRVGDHAGEWYRRRGAQR